MTTHDIDAAVAGRTVPGLFAEMVRTRPDAVAVRWRPAGGEAATESMTWAEYADQACRVAGALSDLGVQRGDRVLLMMRNRPEFYPADMGALLAGATPISIYNSSSPEQIEYLAGHSEATAAIVGDVGMLERFLKVRSELPNLRHLVLIDDPDGLAPADVVPFSRLLEGPPVDLAEAAGKAKPEDILTLIYTSGTTGPPKGVMITHRNLCWVLESMKVATGEPITGWRQVSFLPMAHIAERLMTHYFHVGEGTDVTCCPDPTELVSYMREVRPEHFLGVPRVWEKFHAGIAAAMAADPDKQAAFDEALASGDPNHPVLVKVRELVGLDALKIALTGAAPIPRPVFDFFPAIGVPLSEVYGLSECTGPMTWSPKSRPGTVGPPIPGQELKLLDDGEVCCRGGNVFAGYLKDPERTAEMLDPEGWLHSGDIGELDEAGYVKIVDRKKELIITAGGKNISPANLEAAIKSYPLIGQACAVGDGRPYMTALIVLDPDVAPAWAKSRGIEFSSLADLAANADVRAEVERCVAEANQRFSQVEQIKKVALLGTEWPPDSDELTPTMKLKRRGVLSKYAEEIERLYS
ncbi:MAG TPA: AMP-dependent synthetase/ligase [Acidimicrobiia bacterium]|nr:AMP-dependent synthetase/ligase [Acidimicrobiia bacterium]